MLFFWYVLSRADSKVGRDVFVIEDDLRDHLQCPQATNWKHPILYVVLYAGVLHGDQVRKIPDGGLCMSRDT